MKKRFLAVLLIVAMVLPLGIVTFATEQSYNDGDTVWSLDFNDESTDLTGITFSNATGSIQNGVLAVSNTGSSPRVDYNKSGFSLEAAEISEVRIKVKVPTGATYARFYYKAGSYNDTKSFMTSDINNGEWQELVFKTSDRMNSWKGSITGFRLLFGNATSGFEVEYVKFIAGNSEWTTPVDGVSNDAGWVIDFSELNDSDNAYFYGEYASVDVSGGGLHVTPQNKTSNPRAIYYGSTFSINAEDITQIRILITTPATATEFKVYFGKDNESFSGKSFSVKNFSAGKDYEFVINTTANANWQGVINKFRIDFLGSSGDFTVKYIKFLVPTVDGVKDENGEGWIMDFRPLCANTPVYFEGTNATSLKMLDGKFSAAATEASSTENNPRVIYNGSTFSVNAEKISQIRVLVTLPATAGRFRFYFDNGSGFSGHSYTFSIDKSAQGTEYEFVINTFEHANWQGTVTKFRVDFLETVGTLHIKYIKFIEEGTAVDDPNQGVLVTDGVKDGNAWTMDFSSLSDNTATAFYQFSPDTPLSVENGALFVAPDEVSTHSKLIYNGSTFSVDSFYVARIKLKVKAPTDAQDLRLYFSVPDGGFSGEKCFKITDYKPGEWQEIVIDTNTLAEWTGTIGEFRIDFTRTAQGYYIESIKFYMSHEGRWFTEKEAVTDYDYSFCVVGDTQVLTERYPHMLPTIYDWILENKDEKKIEHVFGLGDIIQYGTEEEWDIAKNAISRLDGKISYSLVRGSGNHDSPAGFNDRFGTELYKSQFDGFYGDGIENSYRTFRAGNVNYLFVTLEFGPSDDVLEWASSVIERHPNHRVIITTHMFLYNDGTTLDYKDSAPAHKNEVGDGTKNNGDEIWDKLGRKHENIFMILCGHDSSSTIVTRQVEGDHGNIVTQMLINPQGVDGGQTPTGMVAMFYFSNDGQTVDVEYYSTIREMYYMPENQFTLDIPEYQASSDGITSIYGNTLSLESDVKVMFVLDIDTVKAEGATVEIGLERNFTVDTQKIVKMRLSELETRVIDGKTYYVVSYGVPAKDMAATVMVRLIKDGEVISTEYRYSAQNYIDKVLLKQVGGEITVSLKNLVKALDVYGKNACAVLADGPVCETLTGVDFSKVTDATGSRSRDMMIRLSHFSLELKSNVKLRVYFSLTSSRVDINDFTFKVNGEVRNVTSTSNKYIWCIEESVTAIELNDTFTFTIESGDSSLTLNLSALYYAKIMSEKAETEAEKNLMKAIYKYWEAAEMYSEYRELSGKAVYSFGDSLVAGHYSGNGMLDGLTNAHGMVYTKYAKNGATINKNVSNGGVYAQIEAASTVCPDFIVFDGLTNDVSIDGLKYPLGEISEGFDASLDTTTFCGSFEAIIKLLKEKYPTAKIIFVTPHKMPTRQLEDFKLLVDTALEICEKWGVTVANVYYDGGIDTTNDAQRVVYSYNNNESDGNGNGTHLTGAGYDEFYAPIITEKMLELTK